MGAAQTVRRIRLCSVYYRLRELESCSCSAGYVLSSQQTDCGCQSHSPPVLCFLGCLFAFFIICIFNCLSFLSFNFVCCNAERLVLFLWITSAWGQLLALSKTWRVFTFCCSIWHKSLPSSPRCFNFYRCFMSRETLEIQRHCLATCLRTLLATSGHPQTHFSL